MGFIRDGKATVGNTIEKMGQGSTAIKISDNDENVRIKAKWSRCSLILIQSVVSTGFIQPEAVYLKIQAGAFYSMLVLQITKKKK
jgi:hypothetical protein